MLLTFSMKAKSGIDNILYLQCVWGALIKSNVYGRGQGYTK